MRGALLAWPDVVATVSDGERVVFDRDDDASAERVRLFLLGPVGAAILRQRGSLPLHASAVAPPGRPAIAFVGWCGWGKSTTAAAFYRRGWVLVADDIVGVTVEGSVVCCVPAYPRIRIGASTARRMELVAKDDPAVSEDNAGVKLSLPAGRDFETVPRRLSAVFVLRRADLLDVERIRPAAALPELLRHTFTAAWLRGPMLEQHLDRCVALANAVPVFRLSVPERFEALDEVVRVVSETLDGRARATG